MPPHTVCRRHVCSYCESCFSSSLHIYRHDIRDIFLCLPPFPHIFSASLSHFSAYNVVIDAEAMRRGAGSAEARRRMSAWR